MRFDDNWILGQLPADELDFLAPDLAPTSLPLRLTIEMPLAPITHVHFVTEGIVSVVGTAPDRSEIEVAIIGREGMTGLPLFHGVDRWHHRSFIQGDGGAYRLPADVFAEGLRRLPAFRALCGRFVIAFMHQVSSTSVANGKGTVEQRLARWLVMAQDRVGGTEVQVTHEFLSYMLAVRRAGVTNAVHILEGDHLIRATRGLIVVRDRQGLIERARYYGQAEAEYGRLLGDFREPARRSQPARG